jgi:ABC-type polar amino acid transport system ATPase subunit
MLMAESISKNYPGAQALDKVSVTVKPGRITMVIGPSGSGKTTLIRSLALLDPPDVGNVIVDDTRYVFPASRKMALPPWPRVTVVFQQLFLWPHLTLRENILLARKLKREGSAGLDEMVDLFGMAGFLDRYPNEVSVGQRQRAALARATILNPSYVLLDEITSAVDIEQMGAIMHYLLSLRDRGMGLLLITHLVGFVRRVLRRKEGDEFVFLDNGHLLEQGGIESLENPMHPRLRRFLATADEID